MSGFTFHRFAAGAGSSPASLALDAELAGENADMTYSQMMRLRLAGLAAEECTDTYFIALDENGKYAARLWHGWGKHPAAAGNFGNFKTLECHQGRGIGRRLLDLWFADLQGREDRPLALFCTSSKPWLVRLYGEYGFRPAVSGTEGGPLYCPLGDSPRTFREFYERYYDCSTELKFKPATIGWRHEIDCLLHFAMLDRKLSFGLPGAVNLEYALIYPKAGKAELIFTEDRHCVGWAFTPVGGRRCIQVYPEFRHLPIRECREEN